MVHRPPAPLRLLRFASLALTLLAPAGQLTSAAQGDGSRLPAAAGDSAIATGMKMPAPAAHESFPEEKEIPAEKNAPARKSNSPIPEPAAAALGLLGLGLIVFRRYRV